MEAVNFRFCTFATGGADDRRGTVSRILISGQTHCKTYLIKILTL
jgi:hypothetical protein